MQTNKPLFILIVLLLVINIVLFVRVGNLGNQIQSLRYNYDNIQSSVRSISGDINNTLQQFTREQSWITPVRVDHNRVQVDGDVGIALLNWQIKDFKEGADVVFHYRQGDSKEFVALPAKDKGDGFFETEMPFRVDVKPLWEISVSQTHSAGRTSSETVSMAAMAEKTDADYRSVDYYVSMKSGDTIQSSEMANYDVAYLANMKYDTIVGHAHIHDKQYHVSLFDSYGDNKYASVTVSFYDGKRFIGEKMMEISETHDVGATYELNYDGASQDISRLIIQVKYADGRIFEKEIHL